MSNISKFMIKKGCSIGCVIITSVFTIAPEEIFTIFKIYEKWSDLTSVIVNRLFFCVAVIVLANIGFLLFRKCRKSVSVKGKNYAVQIEYGDLLTIKKGKVIIDFDECFTTTVGNAPEDIKPESVCGQYLEIYPIVDMQRILDTAGVKPANGKSQYKGLNRYEPGTIVPKDEFFLMAFTKLDKDGLGNLTYNDYIKCLNKLWEQIDKYHGTSDVYMPILGSKITRFDKELSQQELLDIIISSYRLSPKKLNYPNKLHIVCKEREGFSLNDVYGIS